MGVQLLGICACSFEGLVKDGGTAIGNLTCSFECLLKDGGTAIGNLCLFL